MATRFGFWSEQETQVGHSYSRRLHELVDEALLAEKMNFDFVALSEQHVALGGISSSAPEIVFGYLAAKTSRIGIRGSVMLMPKKINHPLRTAERISVLDILSNGRFEAYFGRANTTIAMRAFNVDPSETQEQLEEGLDVIRKAMRNDVFSHEGKNYQIPPRMLVPKPLQKPHPRFGIAATSVRSHVWAGQQGLGVISTNLYQGWEAQADLIKAYRDAWVRDPDGPSLVPSVGVPIFVGIGKTDQEAKDIFAGPFMHYAQISTDAYPRLAKIADDYAYMGENNAALQRAATDWDYLLNESGTTVCGSPDTVVRQLERFPAIGVDDLIFHIDSVPHEQLMTAIEMIGRYVIPHFRDRNNVVRPTEEILDTIRAMRPKPAGAAAAAE